MTESPLEGLIQVSVIPIPTPDILICWGQFTHIPVVLSNRDIPVILSNWDVGDWGHQSDTAGTRH